MKDDNYSKREIDFHFQDIKETLARIEFQVTKTNGRVTKCEENIGVVKTSGRVANWAFGLTIPLIVSMAVWIFFNQLQYLSDKIDTHIIVSERKLEALNK